MTHPPGGREDFGDVRCPYTPPALNPAAAQVLLRILRKAAIQRPVAA